MWTFTRFVQPEVDIREYLHASEHVKIFNTIITVRILSTMKKTRNHPIYWRLRWCLFHIVMGSKCLLWKILSKLYYELSWHICIILYPIQLITKPFVYWGVIFYVILLCITTPNIKNLKQNKSDFCTIQGFCTSKIILSAYMYQKNIRDSYARWENYQGTSARYFSNLVRMYSFNEFNVFR